MVWYHKNRGAKVELVWARFGKCMGSQAGLPLCLYLEGLILNLAPIPHRNITAVRIPAQNKS